MLDVSASASIEAKTHLVDSYDAKALLCAPFDVFLIKSVKQIVASNGKILETIIPDPDGLVKAVAQQRALHPQKLGALDLKFLRTALEFKSSAFAEKLSLSHEHLSRLESGAKVMSPQSEMLVRVLTFAYTVNATKFKDAKGSEFAKQFAGIFEGIKPCWSVDNDPIRITLVRVPMKSCSDETDGLWDESKTRVA